MPCLVDTNVLVSVTSPARADHQTATDAIANLTAQGDDLVIAPQNLFEFWAVATRPMSAKGGLGMTEPDTELALDRMEQTFRLLPDLDSVYKTWRSIVHNFGAPGLQAHDARLASVMLLYGVERILTFNGSHFARFPHVTVVDPATVASSGP